MRIIHGDCLEELKKLPENSVDAVVTDPPYGLSFMGKKWDYDVPSVEIWQECLRVLKPGGYLLAFAGTRTQHRMAVRIEDAGFEIRDMIAWIYGSGFPKSLNIGKAVDKLQGNERVVLSTTIRTTHKKGTSEWEGWGTALKPALEPITVARKPIEGTVAENCLKWGVGGINIDECRVEGISEADKNSWKTNRKTDGGSGWAFRGETSPEQNPQGRFPANLIHDGSDEVVELFPNTKSGSRIGEYGANGDIYGKYGNKTKTLVGNSGSASRFFYCAKASKSERNMGCEGLEERKIEGQPSFLDEGGFAKETGKPNKPIYNRNHHPTVKPIALMEYLIKLVSLEGHTILDPFMGSGTAGIACKKLKRHFIGIERESEYIKIAESRIAAQPSPLL